MHHMPRTSHYSLFYSVLKKRAFENIGLSRRPTACCMQEINRDMETIT
jgi:hypothetical protein